MVCFQVLRQLFKVTSAWTMGNDKLQRFVVRCEQIRRQCKEQYNYE